MSLQLRAVICFAVVAEERSFTRAAERMRLTQPWVSEQVRLLEAHLGFPLLVRAGRQFDLTPEGVEFLVHARALVALRDDMDAWATRKKSSHTSRLRIGTLASTARVAQRTQLLDRFIARYDQIDVEIIEDRVPVLTQLLEARELDIIIVFDRDHFERPEFDVLRLVKLDGYLLVEATDPLAADDSLRIEAMRGRHVVTTPYRVNPNIVDSLERWLQPYDVTLVSAPETDRSSVERFARRKGMSVFRWLAPGLPKTTDRGMTQMPVDDPLSFHLVVVRNANLPTRNVERFWRLAEEAAASVTLEDR